MLLVIVLMLIEVYILVSLLIWIELVSKNYVWKALRIFFGRRLNVCGIQLGVVSGGLEIYEFDGIYNCIGSGLN